MGSGVDMLLRRGRGFDAYFFYAGRFVRDAARSLMAVLAVIYLVHVGLENTEVGIVFGASLAGGFVLSLVAMLTSRLISTRAWSVANMLLTGLAGVVLIVVERFLGVSCGRIFRFLCGKRGALGRDDAVGADRDSGSHPSSTSDSCVFDPDHGIVGRACGWSVACGDVHVFGPEFGLGCDRRLPRAAVVVRGDASRGSVDLHAAIVGE